MKLSEAVEKGMKDIPYVSGNYLSKTEKGCSTLGAALITIGVEKYSTLNEAKEILVEKFPVLKNYIEDVPFWHYINSMEIQLLRQREEDPRYKCLDIIKQIEQRTK